MGALDPVATGSNLDPVASRRIGAPRKYRAPLRVVCSGKGPTGWYSLVLKLRFARFVFLFLILQTHFMWNIFVCVQKLTSY